MKSIGKLIYSPRSHLGDPSKWLILACDDEICKYYSVLYRQEYPWLPKLMRPVFGAHISIIRGEKVPNYNLWRMDENKIIEFEYDPGVINNDEYYWLRVKCPYLEDLRIKYGLSPQPKYGFHLTIGRVI